MPPLETSSGASEPPALPHTTLRETNKKKRKRKSVILVRKKRRSSGNSIQNLNTSNRSDDTHLEHLDGGSESQANEAHDKPAGSNDDLEPSRPSTRHSSVSMHQRRPAVMRSGSPNIDISMRSPLRADLDDQEDGTYIDEEHTPEPETPVVARKSRNHDRRNGPGGGPRRNPREELVIGSRGRAESSYPFVVHRLTNTEALPTITEEFEAEMDDSDDINHTHEIFPDRPPNAVDVLAQICRETIETAISKIEAGIDSRSSRADAKRKRSALEAFGAQLDGKLFDMSAALENRMTLEARYRKSKRAKGELQARWTEVRRQRQELALKTDAIRRKYWRSEAVGKERHELSERLHELEMQVENDDSVDNYSLEFTLRDVAGNVSNAEGGNLLERLRLFNQQLESTAAFLEGRTVS